MNVSIQHKVENARDGGVRLTHLYKVPSLPCAFLHSDGLVEFLESVRDKLDTCSRVSLEIRFPYILDVALETGAWWENDDYVCHAHACRIFAIDFGATDICAKGGDSLSGWVYPDRLISSVDKLIDLLMQFEGHDDDQVVVQFANTIITIETANEH